MLDLRSINRHAGNPQAGIHGDPAGFPPDNCGNDGERALFTRRHRVATASGTADFNGNAKPDYLLHNPSTRRTALWYLNNNLYTDGAFGPTLPAGWNLVAP
jgi:hypothetical protein